MEWTVRSQWIKINHYISKPIFYGFLILFYMLLQREDEGGEGMNVGSSQIKVSRKHVHILLCLYIGLKQKVGKNGFFYRIG